MSPEVPLILVLACALVGVTIALYLQSRKLHDAEASYAAASRELAVKGEAEIQTRNLLSMLSTSLADTTALVAATQGTVETVRGLAQRTEGVLDFHLHEARKILEATAAEDRGHERLTVVLNGEIHWLRRALYADRSHERASADLQAERLVRDADAREDAIAAGPALGYNGSGPSFEQHAHQFATQGRVPEPYDEEPPTPEPASAGGPVPGTE